MYYQDGSTNTKSNHPPADLCTSSLVGECSICEGAEEIWRLTSSEGYEVSNHGRVRSLPRKVQRGASTYTVAGGLLAVNVRKDGYPQVGLGRTTWLVHHLVAEAFCEGQAPGLEVRHLDDVKDHNHPDNLAWGTRSENMHDSVRNGRHTGANKTTCKHGHEYTEENTFLNASGKRECRTCIRQRNAERLPSRRVPGGYGPRTTSERTTP